MFEFGRRWRGEFVCPAQAGKKTLATGPADLLRAEPGSEVEVLPRRNHAAAAAARAAAAQPCDRQLGRA